VLLDSERQARAEAERTSRMKDEFLTTLSHELRTPLSAILGWAQVLRRGSRDQADLHRGLQTIERNARAQAQLIEDLLDMSSITSARCCWKCKPLSPNAIAAPPSTRCARRPRPSTSTSNSIDIRPGILRRRQPLQQIIWNLLSNALKFTPAGGTVKVSVRREDEQVAIAVRDSGIGIEHDFLDHVFERFRQADATTTRQHGGLGLGLAIVKHLVEQHGGTVSAAATAKARAPASPCACRAVPTSRPRRSRRANSTRASVSRRTIYPACRCWWWTTRTTPAS
jgi:signal transduction histidine kinase